MLVLIKHNIALIWQICKNQKLAFDSGLAQWCSSENLQDLRYIFMYLNIAIESNVPQHPTNSNFGHKIHRFTTQNGWKGTIPTQHPLI